MFTRLLFRRRDGLVMTLALVAWAFLVGFVIQGFHNEGWPTGASWIHVSYTLLIIAALVGMSWVAVFWFGERVTDKDAET
ncbi:MAG TPA: hypothetical protein PK406_00545 [Verrucomicrobiota bacterium]|nr:hypothetical protein [Verrucomicrobiota bacterium]